MWGALLGAAGGALLGAKKQEREQQIEDADRKLASETQRYSWVTGNQAQPIRNAGGSWMNMGQGALSGAMFGQQFGDGSWKDLQAQEEKKRLGAQAGGADPYL